MRSSMIRTGVVASAAAFALAACGGHGLVPSQSAAPVADFINPMAVPTCAKNPPQPAWIFKGACKAFPLGAAGATVKLPAWHKVALTVKLPQNNVKGKAPFVLVDATYTYGDVEPYKGTSLPRASTKQLKSVLYVQAVNSFSGLKFTKGDLVFTLTAPSYPGTSCPLFLLEKNAKTHKFFWFGGQFLGLIKGKTMTYTIPGSTLLQLFPKGLPKGPLYFNSSCKVK